MTSAARLREAEKANAAFQVALTQIGAATVQEALDLWGEVPPTARPAQAATWLGKAIRLIMGRRAQSRALARAYYRLARALRTGSTIPDPRNPDPSVVTLSQLRREFRLLVGDTPVEQGTDDEDIPVEKLDPDPDSEKRQEREAEQEARIVMGNHGPINLDKKVREIDTDKPAVEVDEERKQAHEQAGSRQAAAAERIVLNGARDELWDNTRRDKRALGYIRLSRTGTPCGWCAMLISRGPVYKTKQSAEYADGDKYHDNCHCYAVAVYSREEYKTDPMYALNREYAELWPQVTSGLGGKYALTAWRRFIRTQQRAQEARSQAAQEA